MKLGVDVFTLRSQGWKAIEHIEYASRIGLDIVHFSDPSVFDSLEDSYLAQLKNRADELGISIEVGMWSICPTSTSFSAKNGTAEEQLTRMLHVAKKLGSPALRCILGSNADRQTEIPLAAHMEATAAVCRAVRSLAIDLNVKIAIENHAGDMQGRELKELIEEAGPEYVGACIDTGNPLWVGESPFVTLEHLAPYIVMTHVRDSAVWSHPRGATVQWVAIGEGSIGIDNWVARFRELCPNANLTLELISNSPPRVLPYLEPDYWTIYPETPAAEFAHFLALVHKGSPYTGPVLTAPWNDPAPEIRAALALQERRHLEQSVRYCREHYT